MAIDFFYSCVWFQSNDLGLFIGIQEWPHNLRNFIQFVKNQFDASIKIIRLDNNVEFLNAKCTSIFQSLDIVYLRTCIYTSQQNRVTERKHRHLLKVARALRFQGHIPIMFWGDCILTTTYIINRLPSKFLHDISPNEKFHKIAPSLSHMRTLRCLCYGTYPNPTDKFSLRAIIAVFMGYSPVQKGYRLYSLQSHTFFVSRDIHFREHIFPFKNSSIDTSHSSPLLPHSYLFDSDTSPRHSISPISPPSPSSLTLNDTSPSPNSLTMPDTSSPIQQTSPLPILSSPPVQQPLPLHIHSSS